MATAYGRATREERLFDDLRKLRKLRKLRMSLLGTVRGLEAKAARLQAENERLRSALATLCYEAHVVVKASLWLSMAGLDVKPSIVKLYEAKEAAQAVLSESTGEGGMKVTRKASPQTTEDT